MTEYEWSNADKLDEMLVHVQCGADQDNLTSRRLRLLICACARRVWPLVLDQYCRRAVETAEQYVDGIVSDTALENAWYAAYCSNESIQWTNAAYYAGRSASYAAMGGVCRVWNALQDARKAVVEGAVDDGDAAIAAECRAQVRLARDIFGNPFRPLPALAPLLFSWSGGAIRAVAETIYNDGRFSELPYLADMLEEAGCMDNEIISHCRGNTEHVRGCWVVDMLLGRKRAESGKNKECHAPLR